MIHFTIFTIFTSNFNIYYWLCLFVSWHSAKRSEIYKEFVNFTDTEHLQLLRYCSTRWLSLYTCIQRVLSQWAALQAYFNSCEDERSAKVRQLANYLNDPEVKFYFLFLSTALKPLVLFNTSFQVNGLNVPIIVHKSKNLSIYFDLILDSMYLGRGSDDSQIAC